MSAISNLFQKGKSMQFKKGDFFISPGKTPNGIYQINEGFIYSYSKSPSQKKRIQMILKQGDVFPIAWTINVTNARKDMHVQALTDGSIQMLEKKVFIDFINTSHEASLEIISVLLMYLSVYVERVENLEDDSLKEKLINRLLVFANRFGVKEGKTIRINLPITHKLIAESLGVSRESVTRELKVLERQKFIYFKNHQLFIADSKQLIGALPKLS